MPSFTYGELLGTPKIRAEFVSFSVKSSSGKDSQYRRYSPSSVCVADTTPAFPMLPPWSEGFFVRLFQDYLLRNHSVGSTWITAASGPRLASVMRIPVSSGPA